MRTREKRKALRLPAQMRSDIGWSDVHINDVSGRGMMLTRIDAPPPPPGSYLEVRRGTVAVVARIVWRHGRKFGVRAQDSIDMHDLIAAKPLPDAETTGANNTRRRPAPVETAARSRHFARLFQYAVLLVAIGAGTVALAGSVTRALAPLRTIEASLIGG